MNQIDVLKPGALSTVQDLGRSGHQHLGVPVCGAMDAWSHRLANALVGNPGDAAALEITLLGPSLRFAQPTLIAITGADLSPRIGEQPVPLCAPVLVQAGSQLDFGRRVAGMRASLAVHGGIGVPLVLGSRATCLRAGFGGLFGRALRKGDALPVGAASLARLPSLPAGTGQAPGFTTLPCPTPLPQPGWLPADGGAGVQVRLVAGQEWDAFSAEAQAALCSAAFRLSPQSDRMGLRLQGPVLALLQPLEMISEAVAFGTVQVPPDGQPIVLMADRQTTGGYPKIACVASADGPLLAQLAPQEAVRFARVNLDEARRLDSAQQHALAAFAAAMQAFLEGPHG